MTTISKGAVTELNCIKTFIEFGYHVSIPYGNSAKYDFIADINGKLIRVQVKTANWVTKGESFIIWTTAVHTNSNGNSSEQYTDEQIDYFSTFFDGNCYLIPVNDCKASKTLRLKPPFNGIKKNYKFS